MRDTMDVIDLTQQKLAIFLTIFGDLTTSDNHQNNKRRHGRRPSAAMIEFLRLHGGADAEMCRGRCVDISEGGIGFVCKDPVTIGEKIHIYLNGEMQTYTVQAEVIHSVKHGAIHRIGARFIWS